MWSSAGRGDTSQDEKAEQQGKSRVVARWRSPACRVSRGKWLMQCMVAARTLRTIGSVRLAIRMECVLSIVVVETQHFPLQV